jgi:hypothetical protein
LKQRKTFFNLSKHIPISGFIYYDKSFLKIRS